MDTQAQHPISEDEFNSLEFEQAISKTGKAYWRNNQCDGFLGFVEQGPPSYRTYAASFYRNLSKKRANPDSGYGAATNDYKRPTLSTPSSATATTSALERPVTQSELQTLIIGQADLVGRLEAMKQLLQEIRDSVDALAIPQ